MDKPAREKLTDDQKPVEKKDAPAPEPAPVPAETGHDDEPEESGFDFGGLPNRNLKKNLGCG